MQPNPAPSSLSIEERRDEFVPVHGGAETISPARMLVAAYALMWLLAVLFIYATWRRQNALDRRLSGLEKALADKASGEASARTSQS